MDKTRFAAHWNEIRPKVKGHWNRLTDEDLDRVQGDPDALTDTLVERYDEPRQAIALELKHLVEQRTSVSHRP